MKLLKPLPNTWANISKGRLNCGTSKVKMPMNYKLFMGFGGDTIYKDGKVFYQPEMWRDGTVGDAMKKNKSLMWVELQARKSPNSDWRLKQDNPLYDKTYQRQGKNNWVLVKKGNGFA